MNPGIHSNVEGNVRKICSVIAYTIFFEESKQRIVRNEKCCHGQQFLSGFAGNARGEVGPL